MGETRNANASRQRILEAAEAIFAAEGYSGARVDAIAAQAGINKRMLYHYFGDKKGLYQAVIQEMVERLIQKLTPALQSAQEMAPETGLRAVINAYLDTIQTEPHYVRLAIHEAVHGWQSQEAIADELQAGDPDMDGLEDRLDGALAVLQHGIAAGRFRSDLNPRLLFTTITLICRLYYLITPRLQVFLNQPIDSPEGSAWVREQIISLFLYGVITRPSL